MTINCQGMVTRRRLNLSLPKSSTASLGVAGRTSQTQTTAQTPQTETEVQKPQQSPQRQPDVVYVPTPQEVVDEMLALAKVDMKVTCLCLPKIG